MFPVRVKALPARVKTLLITDVTTLLITDMTTLLLIDVTTLLTNTTTLLTNTTTLLSPMNTLLARVKTLNNHVVRKQRHTHQRAALRRSTRIRGTTGGRHGSLCAGGGVLALKLLYSSEGDA